MAQLMPLPLTVSCFRYDTIRDAILTCALKPTWISLIYRTELTTKKCKNTHTHLTALCPRLPGWAGTRKIKPIWILLKQETVSGSGIHWAICKSAPRSRQITMPAPHRSVFYRPDALPASQPTVSKHWRQKSVKTEKLKSRKQICSEITVNSLGNPRSESWKRKGRTAVERICRKGRF